MSGVDSGREAATAVDPPVDPPLDGRTARAQRTRAAIVEACVQLINAGDPRPTAPRIAEGAGVSVRSVFQHFDDLETLFAMVAERAVEGLADLVQPVDPSLPFPERLDRFLSQRAELLEALTPIRRAAAVHAPSSPAIRSRLQDGHVLLRSELKAVFGPEIAALPPSRRSTVLDMLDVAATWSSWDVLRTLEGRSIEQATEVVASLIRAILGVDRAGGG